ncbi:hypothetical protein Ae201684P_015144 [Aphanomyces euteiches]|nr:hypothetical protein Ae201684P_015144 [Aphanomyces euteiches]KAH9139749.1 hypothetical protein AeRB84_015970 [Aphanomyces euteiches]
MWEGRAEIEVSPSVFLNAHQALQRDLTVLLLRELSARRTQTVSILDAMAGTGIRAIRYAMEVPNVQVVANDLSPEATTLTRANVSTNGVAHLVSISEMDAVDVMWSHRHRFNVIDLDPFGSCATFLPSALATIAPGGLVCATDTDLQTLLGKTTHSHMQSYSQYGALPVSAAYSKELAIRIVLGNAATVARQARRSIRPILCTALEFFVRVHFQVLDEPHHCLEVPLAILHQCLRCAYFAVHSIGQKDGGADIAATCPICSSQLQIGGPFWSGPIHDENILKQALQHAGQLGSAAKLVESILDESADLFYYSLPQLFRPFKIVVPRLSVFRNALMSLNKTVHSTHLEATAFKTNATALEVYSVVAAWLRLYGLPDAIPVPPASVTFAMSSALQTDIEMSPPVKCTLEHVWRPPTRLQTEQHHEGSRIHVYEASADAINSALAETQANDFVVLHGNKYILPEPLRLPPNTSLHGSHSGVTLIGQVVVDAPNVSLFQLHIHFQVTDLEKRKHPLLITAKNAHVDCCHISCGRHASALACIGIADGASAKLNASEVVQGPQAGIFVGGKSQVEIHGCTIHNVSGCGVDIQGGSFCSIVDSRIANCRKSGVFAHAFAELEMRNCSVDANVTTQATATLQLNILSRGKKGGLLVHSRGNVMEASGNVFTRNALAGVDVRGTGSSGKVFENHICNGRASGIYISDGATACIQGNIIVGNKRAGIESTVEQDFESCNTLDGNGVSLLM